MPAVKGPLIAGGRYDGLLSRLGAREPIPAVGFAASIEELGGLRRRRMSAPLLLAIPSKGRLQQNAEAFFARSGLELVKPRGARDYRGAIAGFDGVEIAYLSAAEITAQLAQGAVHLGVTGEDLVREMIPDADRQVVFIDRLGFGFANVVVAVPQAWIDVRSMADLDDVATAFRLKHERKMRLATKYANLTRAFFAEHGVVDYRIVESSGATEAAPAAGTAEMIVDITTTGATLAANGLKVIEDGVILRSQANLVAARTRVLGRGAAGNRAAPARPHRGAKARPCVSRSAHALCRPERRRCSIPRANNSASPRRSAAPPPPACSPCTARPSTCMRWRASCASTAPRRSRSPRSNTSIRATIRCSPGSPPSLMRARRAAAEPGSCHRDHRLDGAPEQTWLAPLSTFASRLLRNLAYA